METGRGTSPIISCPQIQNPPKEIFDIFPALPESEFFEVGQAYLELAFLEIKRIIALEQKAKKF